MSRQKNILIIDDEEYNRLFLNRFLSKNFNCKITEAKSGEEAIELVQSNQFDLITLDINMPGISGDETLKEIRKMNNGKQIPVIIATSLDPQVYQSQLMPLHIQGLFNKLDILEKGLGKGQEQFLKKISQILK